MAFGHHLGADEDVGRPLFEISENLHQATFAPGCVSVHAVHPSLGKEGFYLGLYLFGPRSDGDDFGVSANPTGGGVGGCVTTVMAFVGIGLPMKRHGDFAVFTPYGSATGQAGRTIGKASAVQE